jgi:metal-dependent HD superfamily phosphatase/phosphodiesterase
MKVENKSGNYFGVPYNGNKKLSKLVSNINKNKALLTLLKMSNINAIDRLGYNDHGPTHVRIVANHTLKMLRVLIKRGVQPSIVRNYNMKNEDAEIIVTLASILHDIGHAVHRENHEIFSIIIAFSLIDDLLNGIYDEDEKEIIKFEVLHAIYSHEPEIHPLTIEAGVIKIADALDMEKGRARIPFKIGSINIHSTSAMAIEKVEILEGEKKPIKIIIVMSNPAGIFQVDELLKKKIKTSGIDAMIEVEARLIENGKETIFKKYE